MRKQLSILILIALSVSVFYSCKDSGNNDWENAALETNFDSLSYMLGTNVADNFVAEKIDVDAYAFFQGFLDVVSEGKEPILSEDEKATLYRQFMKELSMKKAEQNKAQGKQFLEANKMKEGVVETASGLQYKIVEAGDETIKPNAASIVTVNYSGSLLNGQVFDASARRGEPFTTPLNSVIPGWTEGLQYVGKGGKIELYIPSDLAYGDFDRDPIPGGSVLIFEIELLDVKALETGN